MSPIDAAALSLIIRTLKLTYKDRSKLIHFLHSVYLMKRGKKGLRFEIVGLIRDSSAQPSGHIWY